MRIGNRLGGVRSAATLLAVAALLAAAPSAFAQQIGPTDDQYRSTLEVISQGQQPQPPTGGGPDEPSAAPSPSAPTADRLVGGLPFTGLEVGGLLAAALALGGAGLMVRRLARQRSATDAGTS